MSQSGPDGQPVVRTLTMPSEANLNGGIFGGWILAQLDKAAGIVAMDRSRGSANTVAIESLRFVAPLRVGEDFKVFGTVARVGRTSMHLMLEAWACDPREPVQKKIVEAVFVVVAVDSEGRPREVPAASDAAGSR